MKAAEKQKRENKILNSIYNPNYKSKSGRKSVVNVFLFSMIILVTVVTLSVYKAQKVYWVEMEKEQAELDYQLKQEERLTGEYQQQIEYSQSDQYIKKAARERLGLVNKDDIVFKLTDQ